MASLLTPKRDCQVCAQGEAVGGGEIVTITTSVSREIFLRGTPTTAGSAQQQAKRFYRSLPGLLDDVGAEMSDVVLERVFFRDLCDDHDAIHQARLDAYHGAGVRGAELPAATYINQPPCDSDQAFEVQIQALRPNGAGHVQVQSFAPSPQGAQSKLVELGDHRHLYITNINGADSRGVVPSNFRQQSDVMFASSTDLLRRHGTTFPNVLRTWCYLDEMDRDYDDFNLSRNEFFKQEHITRLPASTGIRAGLYPGEVLGGFDLYALLNPEGVPIEVMHTPTLNEADEYGSAFSRGMKVVLPEKTVLYISGTASVDEVGATVHLDDVPRQIERMLLNVKELLRPHGSTFADTVQTITYLKHADYISTFQNIWQEWGFEGLPNTCVEAGVCRPDLLCEMELIAIIPSETT